VGTKIAIIGNAAGGKSTLARAWSRVHGIPLLVIDDVQWKPNWTTGDEAEVLAAEAKLVAESDRWIIDGFGPWPLIESRFERAETIVFIDYPVWVHYYMAAERQIKSALGQDMHEPAGCRFADVTKLLFEIIWRVHDVHRPRIIELLKQYHASGKVLTIESPEVLDTFAINDCNLGTDWRTEPAAQPATSN